MSRTGKVCVNIMAIILILGFITIFTGLFIGGGQMLSEQNITQAIKDGFHRALQPPQSLCDGPSNNSKASGKDTIAIALQRRNEPPRKEP